MPLKEVIYVPSVPEHVKAILVSDIGGTNSNFGIFQLIDSKWFYVARQNKGAHIESSAKIGRNDACSCGSGKKFKKCCAA